jgi:drug/metabolite transporter (DMT)-like permease
VSSAFNLSRTGWTYTLLLTFLSGVAANGLLVYAQQTVQIGTISIAQVLQPTLAVLWSFLLLGETLRIGQAVGIAFAMAGLAAFLALNQRGERARWEATLLETPVVSEAGVPPALP